MKFHYVTGEMKSHDPKDVAKSIYDFFFWQYQQSVEEEVNARTRKSAALAANAAAKREYENENMLGWGPNLPYKELALQNMDREAEEAAKQRKDMKTILDFVVNRLIEGYVDFTNKV